MEAESNARILVIKIDISDSIKGDLIIHENDDPDKISQDFINKYSLDSTMKKPLIEVIKSHQEKFRKKKQTVHKKQQSQGTILYKNSANTSVAQRLLKHSFRYSSPSKKCNSHANINYGHLLYEKGKRMKENNKQLSEKRIQDKETESKKNLTFKPEISQNSKEIVKTWEREKKQEKNREHMQKLYAEKQEEEMKECYFVPQIIQKSNRTIDGKNIFDSLYQDACVRRNSQETIMNSSKEGFKKSEIRRKSECTDEYFDKLSNSKKKTDEEIARLKREFEADYDKITGQKYFTPVTGRKPNSARGERPIWDELYSSRNAVKEKIEEKKIQESEKFYTQPSESTCRFYENFKTHKFEALFKKLDSDRDGKISVENISLEDIEIQVIEVLSPIFKEMEETRAAMGLEEFVMKLDGLYAKITPQDKMVLIKNKAQICNEQLTFAPVINENSKRIAVGSKLHLGSNVYERSSAEREIRDLKMKKARELKEMQKKIAC